MEMKYNVSESDSDNYENLTSPETAEKDAIARENLLPCMSKERYEHAYNKFMDWRLKNNVNSFSERVLVGYFCDLRTKYKSSTLWSTYSMLRGTLIAKHDVNIALYCKLKALLRKESLNYVAKKANVLTNDDIKTFIETAPNELYLLTKTALIFGISGCMRKHELYNVKIGDVTDVKSALIVVVPSTKSKKPRKFVITDNFYNICKEYINLRPLGMNDKNQKFFVNFHKGKCTKQVVGINKFGKLVQDIAKFLQLPHPQTYTGHTYRRTSATIFDDKTDDLNLNRYGVWQPSGTADGFLNVSTMSQKVAIPRIVKNVASTSGTKPISSVVPENHCGTPRMQNLLLTEENKIVSKLLQAPICFQNCSNLTINFKQ